MNNVVLSGRHSLQRAMFFASIFTMFIWRIAYATGQGRQCPK